MNPTDPTNPTNPTNPMNAPPVECIGIIGLGYVGLSLASAFGRVLSTVGFDIDGERIRELQAGYDRTGEAAPEALRGPHLELTNDPSDLRRADFLVVTVPTPVDRAKRPDLSHLIDASRLVGQILKARSRRPTTDDRIPPTTSHEPNKPDELDKPNKPIIVYESTVYPGCTEEVCVPVLEQESGLRAAKDFKVGYSPERINPGDVEHTLETVVKVVAAQDEETAETIRRVYSLVVKAGVHKAPDIRTAEAAKVIENIQRDLNIALMNELAMLFHRLGLDTHEVLEAARTKWNFLPFRPGLVGGHCIPVDPYYLTHKAQEIGYHPDVILAGRRINDSMGAYVAQETVKLLIEAGKAVRGARILVLGITFKEDVRDVRNSRAVDMVQELQGYGCAVFVHDPMVTDLQLKRLGLSLAPYPFGDGGTEPNKPHQPDKPDQPQYDAVILAVPHRVYRERSLEAYTTLLDREGGAGVLVDVKGVLPLAEKGHTTGPDLLYWSL